jgi:Skp family chaperone for outer membrane proteins
MLTLGLVALMVQPARAQDPTGGTPATTTPPPAVTLRLRILNLNQVIKTYKRTESMQAEFKAHYKQFEDDYKVLKEKSEARTKQMQDPQYTTQQKELIEKEIKRLQREMAEKNEEMRAALAKKEGEMVTLLYKEVDEAVRKYAQSAGIEMVLFYNDAITDSDRFNPMNIARKISAGACYPMYLAPGLDISNDIAKILNDKYPGTAAVPSTETGSTAGVTR